MRLSRRQRLGQCIDEICDKLRACVIAEVAVPGQDLLDDRQHAGGKVWIGIQDAMNDIRFLGEGQANLDLYRQSAINYLNDGSADPSGNNTSNQTFAQLTHSTSATSSYDLRVRGMVALLMTLQRFQEQ